MYAKDGEQLFIRAKESYDGAMPSGNSVAAKILQLLAQMTGEITWQEMLEKQLSYLAGSMAGYPSGHSYGLMAMMDVWYPSKELICTFSDDLNKVPKKMLAQLSYLEETVQGLSVVVKTKDNQKEVERLIPYLRNYPLPEKGEQFYLCMDGKCMKPVPEFTKLLPELEKEK